MALVKMTTSVFWCSMVWVCSSKRRVTRELAAKLRDCTDGPRASSASKSSRICAVWGVLPDQYASAGASSASRRGKTCWYSGRLSSMETDGLARTNCMRLSKMS